jgi:formamidopyrimidine-DNA glycosylase
MFRKAKYILKTAIGKNAKISKYPGNWLLPHRMKGDFCPHCKGKMETVKIGGRTTYFCPGLQKI